MSHERHPCPKLVDLFAEVIDRHLLIMILERTSEMSIDLTKLQSHVAKAVDTIETLKKQVADLKAAVSTASEANDADVQKAIDAMDVTLASAEADNTDHSATIAIAIAGKPEDTNPPSVAANETAPAPGSVADPAATGLTPPTVPKEGNGANPAA